MTTAAKTPKTVLLPAGRFVRGGGVDDRFTNATELPRGEIAIENSFGMSIYAVTVDEWNAFDGSGNAGAEGNLPVTGVAWFEAVDYAAWLSEETAETWRLPTEDEWEYACRAGTNTPFHTGNDITTDQANFLYSEDGSRVGPCQLKPVGSYPPNAFGLYDMHGNVSEWTLDCWRPSHDETAPIDESRRAVRGGGWDYLPRLLRSSWRDSLSPGARRDDLGFRLVVER